MSKAPRVDRAYSTIQIRAVEEEERVIRGVATTPRTDRVGDIIDPLGVAFKNPMPLLHQHRASEPVGTVKFDKPTADGITFEARLPKIDRPGPLKDRVDTAWDEVKLGLVRAVSVGFRVLEDGFEILKTGGLRFTDIEVMELSLVTIPANVDATIQTIKQFDTDLPAAPGTASPVSASPRVRGSVKLIKPNPPRGGNVKITEQIVAFEATLTAKRARMNEIQELVGKEGRSKDESEREEFTTIEGEVDALTKELVDLRKLEKMNVESAKPVDAKDQKTASDSRSPVVRVETMEPTEKGLGFARLAMCLFAANGDVSQALNLAKTHYGNQERMIGLLKAVADSGGRMSKYIGGAIQMKAAVAGASTTDAAWAGNLLAYNTYLGDFIEFLRPRTIIGQFGQDGRPDFRRIPFNVHIKGQNLGGAAFWTGQGKGKKLTKFGFSDAYHAFFKVAAITVLDEEILRFSDPSAERLVRDSLAEVAVARIDATFIDPAEAAVANVSPASILNGVAAVTGSGGTDGAAVLADLAALWAPALAANLPLDQAVYITTPSIALALSFLQNPLGQNEFPGLTMKGGTLRGVPVIVSNYVPAGTFALVFPQEIYLSDDGQATIDASREATIEMTDAPAMDSVTPTAAASHMVNMFQTDSMALRMHRYINWSKRRAAAAQLVEGVTWGDFGS
jgi:HK97 family phage prohead protease/HK97 family phage major capsid protein